MGNYFLVEELIGNNNDNNDNDNNDDNNDDIYS